VRIVGTAVHLVCLLLTAAGAAFSGDVYVVGSLTREATLQPGGKTEGRIILRNTSDEPREVRMYQTDYLCYADGGSVYGDPGSVERSNAPWVTFAPQQLVVPAGEIGSVYYSVEVPGDLEAEGTYWSMLMVEPLGKPSPGSSGSDEGDQNVGIRTVLRYGIQVVTNIGNTGSREMAFRDKSLLAAEDGKRVLRLDIENTGKRWLTPLVWADLYDENGVSVGRFEGGRLRLYPGCSGRFNIDLTQIPKGAYQALIVADNGDDCVFGAQCRLEIE
jgi:hypothetical protein